MSESTTTFSKPIHWNDKPELKQVTLRATVVGLAIGSLVLISNFQFGLQTGWVSMMSLPSALLAVAFFKQIWPIIFPNDRLFTDVETVYVQSMAVAVGTGPLTFGFVGVIPAVEKFVTFDESGGTWQPGQSFTFTQLIFWCVSLAFFGIFFAVPLRKQVIIREKLPFPSGSATAVLIAVLNGSEILQEVSKNDLLEMRNRRLVRECAEVLQLDPKEVTARCSCFKYNAIENVDEGTERRRICDELQRSSQNSAQIKRTSAAPLSQTEENEHGVPDETDSVYSENIVILLKTFSMASLYTVASYFLPILTALPIFGSYLSKNYLWNFQPSPAYIGQGIIMGLPTVSYMFFGAVLGWGILAPIAKHMKWIAPDADVHDWENGVQGWILWCSLSIMVSDSLVGFVVIAIRSLVKFWLADDKSELLTNLLDDSMESMLMEEERAINIKKRTSSIRTQETVRLVSSQHENEVDQRHLVEYTTVISGLIISSIICIVFVVYIFGTKVIPVYSMVIALVLALFLSVLGIRALGETDLNPVSGIGKISQLLFALIVPKNQPGVVLLNIVAGGIAEAGAQQAGDLMQDLKTGHLLNASPRAQFIAQMIGAVWSIVLSSVMYIIYNKIYTLPNESIRIPTAAVWIDCARLVTGKSLPHRAFECSLVLGSIFGVLSLIKNCYRERESMGKYLIWIPSGVAVGVGIYNAPSFTIARFLGGLICHYRLSNYKGDLDAKTKMIVFSSGLVLGEGIFSVVNMFLTSLNVPTW
ncbi:uncharacterized protein KNAG_0F02400 [Huiozyma naganishii CBS 8797]|uniref:OPT superfamily oligopeptide transporter n=1 Tax=Huiozyma naganishii (strain ATCC MYA-139 / BCRC 22969 / CBS 8797 / KCTC 17520 / NBRC 10181 / NCYC 3082 / Yp74L-3) TaxID=1071383 RepID=J7R7Q4_HUIN7|nr:hypothetical protein KNAG_0F02400 [Kazachstania naganishii CBS 8797]CCK70905.1 hypothetical protein KNAG_0F02400 [Kazachstania naganishii CBS 8797]